MSDTADAIVVLITAPNREEAIRLADMLVGAHLAACVQLLPEMESVYRWEGKIENSVETLVFFKLSEERYGAFEEKLRSLHPYDVPEIICLTVDAGSPDYLRWVADNCR